MLINTIKFKGDLMNIHKIINYKENNQAELMSFINNEIIFTRDKNDQAMKYSLKARYNRLKQLDRLNGVEWCNECKQYEPRTNKAQRFLIKYKGDMK